MKEWEMGVLFLIGYGVVAWGMYQTGSWKGHRDAWREADGDKVRVACLEFDLEEMTTQRDALAAYVDKMEDGE